MSEISSFLLGLFLKQIGKKGLNFSLTSSQVYYLMSFPSEIQMCMSFSFFNNLLNSSRKDNRRCWLSMRTDNRAKPLKNDLLDALCWPEKLGGDGAGYGSSTVV